MSATALTAPVVPTPTMRRSAWIIWLPALVGCLLFAAAWTWPTLALTNAAAAVSTAGLLWVPIALLLQHRLAAMERSTLLLGLVLIVQGLHTVEHLVQIIESYRLDFPPVRSLGIVSSLNVEWVHFSWNWIAWSGVVVAFLLGARNRAIALLFAWITAHSLEHTYMLYRYLHVTSELDRLGVARLGSSEVLPGVLGRDGWLALHVASWRGVLGPLASAPRVAVHLWWNVGEVVLLAFACVWTARRRSGRAMQP